VTRVYVPRDAAARSVGADEVADAVRREAADRGLDVTIVRTGTRGMLWLEPLVEVETAEGRVGYGPVSPGDVPGLLDAGLPAGGQLDSHPSFLGPVEDLPWMRDQQRICLARVGVIDPVSLADYEAHGGLAGLRHALSLSPADVVAEVTTSGLRGRGGAGFPAGIKWQTVADTPGDLKFVCCNADEGDSGTFADRMVMEGDPFALLEGMTIAAYAVGASEGYIYLRSEYPDAATTLDEAPAGSGPTSSAPASPSTSTSGSARVPTSAARRPRCSRASRASAGWCGPSRRSRRSPGCSGSRRRSTTCSRW
jgi:formate dehydrogenase iron-sulfur subunit